MQFLPSHVHFHPYYFDQRRIDVPWMIMLMKLRNSSGIGEVKQLGEKDPLNSSCFCRQHLPKITAALISSRASSWPNRESWALVIHSATFVLRKFSSFTCSGSLNTESSTRATICAVAIGPNWGGTEPVYIYMYMPRNHAFRCDCNFLL